MKKNIIKILIFLTVIFPNISLAEIDQERIAYSEVVHDAQIFLELAAYDASSSSGIFNIFVSPGSENMNASGVVLHFATSTIEIKGILTGSSFCDFFLENTFDNQSGKLSLSGMKPFPGVSEASLLGQVIFERKSQDDTSIIISEAESMVLANNGFATNILATTTSLELPNIE